VKNASGHLSWLFLILNAAFLGMTVWGRMRTTAPLILAVLLIAVSRVQGSTRREFLRRFLVLMTTFVVAYLVRNYTGGLISHRVSRFVLCCGLMVSLVLAMTTTLKMVLKRIAQLFKEHPASARSGGLAVLLVGLPSFAFFQSLTPSVWTYDTLPVVPTVVEMYHTGRRDLSRFLPPSGYRRWDVYESPQLYFVREAPGRAGVYSAYPAGMELFAWPVVVVFDCCGYSLFNDDVQLQIEKRTASLVAALALSLFFLIALRFGSPSAAACATIMLATGSVFTSTLGVLLWQQGGVVFWMLAILLVEFNAAEEPRFPALLLQAFACSAMLACRPSAVTFLVPFGVWILARDWRRGLLLPILALISYSPWAAMYWSIYRDPFGPSMGFLKDAWSPGEHLTSVLFSPGRGLFVYQPFFVLLVLLPFVRTVSPVRGWVPFSLGIIGLHLALISSWPCWWGGSCYGSRLVAEVVPIVTLFVVRPIDWILQGREGWLGVVALVVLGLALHVPCVYYDAWLWNALPISADANPWRLWDWANPPFLHGLTQP
jgi:hypothetical protein